MLHFDIHIYIILLQFRYILHSFQRTPFVVQHENRHSHLHPSVVGHPPRLRFPLPLRRTGDHRHRRRLRHLLQDQLRGVAGHGDLGQGHQAC